MSLTAFSWFLFATFLVLGIVLIVFFIASIVEWWDDGRSDRTLRPALKWGGAWLLSWILAALFLGLAVG